MKWEAVDKFATYRMRIPGGWLYRYGGRDVRAMAFVPLSEVNKDEQAALMGVAK